MLHRPPATRVGVHNREPLLLYSEIHPVCSEGTPSTGCSQPGTLSLAGLPLEDWDPSCSELGLKDWAPSFHGLDQLPYPAGARRNASPGSLPPLLQVEADFPSSLKEENPCIFNSVLASASLENQNNIFKLMKSTALQDKD